MSCFSLLAIAAPNFTLLLVYRFLQGVAGACVRVALTASVRDLYSGKAMAEIMSLVFAVFLLVQLRALFGGMAYVQAVTGLTMAQYARSGFFTLSAVGGLTLVTLLIMHAMLRRDSSGVEASYRRFAIGLMVQVSVVMASAVVRMSLYVHEFGLSADRLYTFAGMIWIAIVFAWFSATVLSGRPLRFALGAVYSAWGMLLALNAMNPEGFVVAANARRAIAGAEFDVEYPVTMLSADAVPTLVSELVRPGFPLDRHLTAGGSVGAPCRAVYLLLDRWGPQLPPQRAGWTLAEARARRAIRAHEAEIRARSCAADVPVAASGVAPD